MNYLKFLVSPQFILPVPQVIMTLPTLAWSKLVPRSKLPKCIEFEAWGRFILRNIGFLAPLRISNGEKSRQYFHAVETEPFGEYFLGLEIEG